MALTGRALEFVLHHVLLTAVDHVSRLPRGAMTPEAARLYRENDERSTRSPRTK